MGLRILAVMEALSMTGPAKNLVGFAQLANQSLIAGGPVEVTIATYRRSENPAEDDFVRGVKEAGLRLEIIPDAGPGDLRLAGRLREVCERLEVDLVQSHNVKSHFLLCLSGLKKKIPWVAWNHGYTKPTLKQQIYNSFDYLSLRQADLVITVTESFVPDLLQRGVRREKIEVIGNAIDATAFDGGPGLLRREDYATPGQRLLLAVGRLSAEKAHDSLIEGLAMEGMAGNVLLLVGEGPERTRLKLLAENRGVQLILAGHVTDVRDYYKLADVFVLPSESEGSPNVLLEAMMAGLPIVCTDVGGVRETVTNGVEALLVPPREPKALADAVAQLAADPAWARQLGEQARRRVIAERSPRQRTLDILRIYENQIARPR